MENRKARYMKYAVVFWLLVMTAGVLLASGVRNEEGIGPHAEPVPPEAVQGAPGDAQAVPAPQSETTIDQDPGTYALSNVFLYGNQVAGETNFRPSDLASGDCRPTSMGKTVQTMTLFQDLGTQSEHAADLMRVYTEGSTLTLTNVRLVPGGSPYIVADARIVPKDTTGPFPPYLEMTQAKFRWALPVTGNRDTPDPLIICNFA